MNYEDIARRIRVIVAEQKQISPEKVALDSFLIGEEPPPYSSKNDCNFGFFSFPSSLSGGYSIFEIEKMETILLIEGEFDIDISDEDADKLVYVKDAVQYVNKTLNRRKQPMIESIQKVVEKFQKDLGSLTELFQSIAETLNMSCDRRFTFLLLGRTGVGKSSTVNSLLGVEIAPTNPFEPATMEVKLYEHESNGVHFTVVDTPGLCDDLEEIGNNEEYLELIRSKVDQIDLIWFVSPLDETRVRSDEKRGIQLISEAFGSSLWAHSIIIFTFVDKVDVADYQLHLQKRTDLIRKEIAKCADEDTISETIPSVAVSNKREVTPDGKKWLGELYTTVFVRMAERGALPFLLATANRVRKDPNWKFYNEFDAEAISKLGASNLIDLDEMQEELLRKKLIEYIPALAMAGIGVGSVFGPIGAAIGGAVGTGIGLIAALFS
jgi:predicted GTPase